MFIVGYASRKGIESFDPNSRIPVFSGIDGKSPLGMKATLITDIVLADLAGLALLGGFLAFAFTGSIVPAIIAAGSAGFMLIQGTCFYFLNRYIKENHDDAEVLPLI